MSIFPKIMVDERISIDLQQPLLYKPAPVCFVLSGNDMEVNSRSSKSINEQSVIRRGMPVFAGLILLSSPLFAQFPGGSFRSQTSRPSGGVASTGFQTSTYQGRTANDTSFSTPETAKIKWIDGRNLDEAFKMAKEQNKPLMLHFWNERCQPCMALEQYVFPNPILANTINTEVIAVKVNTIATPNIHRTYGVNRWPWDVFLSPTGTKLRETVSPQSAVQYSQNVKAAAAMYRQYLQMTETQAKLPSPNQRPEPHFAASSAPSRQAAGNRPAGTQASPIQSFSAQDRGTQPATFANSSQNNQTKSAGPSKVQNQFFAGAKSTGTNPTSPSLGMEGYCPVSMLKDEKKVTGSKDWGCVHRGRLYFFASQVYRDLFLKSPDRYAPVLGGYDPVVFQETGKLIEGKTSLGGFVGQGEGRVIFLFSSEETKLKFINDRQRRYIQAAKVATRNSDDNWLR